VFSYVHVGLELQPTRGAIPWPPPLISLFSRLEDEFRAANRGAAPCPVCGTGHRQAADHLFGRSLPSDPAALRRFQKPSPPLALRLPWPLAPLPRDTILPLELVLVGSGSQYLKELLAHLEDLLDRDGLVVAEGSVRLLGNPGQPALSLDPVPSDAAHPLIINDLDDLSAGYSSATALCFTLETPLRLVAENRLTRRFDFSLLARTLMRRISSLAYHYCQHEFEVEYDQLSRLSAELEVDDGEVRFHEGTGLATAGFLGSFTLRGDLQPLIPFLAAGTVCNAGKGAAAGYGRYLLKAE
jgi:hypothetical protein